MAVDIKWLKKCGVSSGAYKKIFTANPADYPPRITKLIDILRRRGVDGKRSNFKEWRAYHAIDLAYDSPFNQTTPTLVRNLLSKKLTAAQTLEELEKWGLTEDQLFLKIGEGSEQKKFLNPPVFYELFVPLVKSYSSIREAKIFNERNNNPLIPFKPLKETDRNRLLCDIVSDVVQTISNWYGYPAVMRQSIKQMLKYGIALTFPREEWHHEQQVHDYDGTPEKVTIKEGIRYVHPHPSRMGYDLEFPLTSINTDTGTRWGFNWTVNTYGTILDNKDYWNRGRIFAGTNWFSDPLAKGYFQEVFPCSMGFMYEGRDIPDREDKAAWYNSTNDRDKAIFLTEHFWKIVPSDWGLGSYDYPVWHRFTLAADDAVIWAEPCAYNPLWFMGYDWDDNAGSNSSLALELIPWQDHLGMILSQMILTAKQNLANIIFYNNSAVDKSDIEKIKNSGERFYRGMNFVGYDALKLGVARVDIDKVFHNIQFNRQSIQEFLQMMPLMLNVMERVLQISAQEAGSAATHQQSKAEVLQTGGASTNRLALTSSYVDEGIDAWGRQLVDGAIAYADPNLTAQVSADIVNLEDHLKELGFKIEGRSRDKATVTGKKSSLRLNLGDFAATTKGPDPAADRELAQALFQSVGLVASNPALYSAVGAKNVIRLLQQGTILASGKKDINFEQAPTDAGGQQPGIPQAVIEAIKQSQQVMMQTIEQKIAQPAAQEVAQIQTEVQQMQAALKQLEGIFKVAQAAQQKTAILAQETQADIQRKDAAASAEQRRKDQETQAEIHRKDAETAARIASEGAKTAAKVESTKQITKAKKP